MPLRGYSPGSPVQKKGVKADKLLRWWVIRSTREGRDPRGNVCFGILIDVIIQDVTGADRYARKKGHLRVAVFGLTNVTFGIVESLDTLAELSGFFGGDILDVVVHTPFPKPLAE